MSSDALLTSTPRKASPSQSSQKLDLAPHLETISLAILTCLVVCSFRSEFHRSIPVLLIELFVTFSIPVAVLCWMVKKYQSFEQILTSRKWSFALQGGAVVYSLLPVVLQIILRPFGMGDAYEVVALSCVLNATWFLAVFSQFGTFGRTSFVLGGALILFICFMTQNNTVMILAFIYAVFSLWWLLGNYWSRLETKAIDGTSKSLPVRGLAVFVTLGVLAIVTSVAMFVVPRNKTNSLRGFMPTSGGESWHDQYARSGIGDGNMLTAGDNASTSGPVDSDQFIEDDKPSMYDIMAEKFDGPVKIRKRKNRAVALDDVAKHMHQTVQSEQKGKSFRTVRKPAEEKVLDLEDRKSKALFFLEGSVPARFGVDCFHHFDGWDWSKADLSECDLPRPAIEIERHLGKPWYVLQNVKRQFLQLTRSHRVKIMRLSSSTLPSSSLLKSWHIHRVEAEQMFYWNDSGQVRMAGEFIPSHTLIDVVSEVPNYHVLRSSRDLHMVDHPNPLLEFFDNWFGVGSQPGTSIAGEETIEDNPDSPYIQIPENDTKARLKELAKEWTEGHKVGWNQVEAITRRLRSDFKYDPAMVPDPECDDSIGSFLDNKGGPSYMFATTAAQMLRSLGYRTRVVSGFLVQRKDFDRLANQSIVTSNNAHMWPEVCLDGWHWIPLEPTPGYPIPFSTETLWQWITAKIGGCIYWMKRNPISAALLFTVIGLCTYFRKELAAIIGWAAWQLMVLVSPQRQLKWTRKLIDLRFWAAGFPRPEFASIENWYTQAEVASNHEFFGLWQKENFSSRTQPTSSRIKKTACRDILGQLTLANIKRLLQKENTQS